MATQMQEAQMQPNQMQDVQAQPMQMQGGQMQPNQMQFAQMQPMQMQGGQMQPNQMQFAQMQPMQMLGGQMQFIQLQPVVSVGSDSLGIMQAGFIEVFRYGTPFKQASERVCAVIDPLLQVAELIPVIGDYIGYAAYCLDLPLMGDLAKDFCCTQGNNTYKVTIGGQLPAEADTKKSLSNLTRFLSAREDTGCCIGAICPVTRTWDLRFLDENGRLQFTVKKRLRCGTPNVFIISDDNDVKLGYVGNTDLCCENCCKCCGRGGCCTCCDCCNCKKCFTKFLIPIYDDRGNTLYYLRAAKCDCSKSLTLVRSAECEDLGFTLRPIGTMCTAVDGPPMLAESRTVTTEPVVYKDADDQMPGGFCPKLIKGFRLEIPYGASKRERLLLLGAIFYVDFTFMHA